MKRLTGLIAAAFTPMREDGSLNLDQVGPIVEHLLGQEISGLFLCGSTGEGESLSSAERRAVTEAYVAAVAGQFPVIVQVGHNSLSEAAGLAEHAARSGVDAIAATAPSYFPLAGAEAVIDCLARVAESAPELPFYYYHIPRLTGVDVDTVRLLELAGERLPTLAGIKFSDFSLDRLARCVEEHGDRYDILFGADEMLLAGIATGAHGAVGSTYNFMGPLYNSIIEAAQRGEMKTAQRLQARAARMVHAMIRHPGLPALKATMKLAGVDCGPPRLPFQLLSDQQEWQLEADLRNLGFFEEGGGR
jgi:N-acetylneuraminate lyase